MGAGPGRFAVAEKTGGVPGAGAVVPFAGAGDGEVEGIAGIRPAGGAVDLGTWAQAGPPARQPHRAIAAILLFMT